MVVELVASRKASTASNSTTTSSRPMVRLSVSHPHQTPGAILVPGYLVPHSSRGRESFSIREVWYRLASSQAASKGATAGLQQTYEVLATEWVEGGERCRIGLLDYWVTQQLAPT
jgi:hypothetical protein